MLFLVFFLCISCTLRVSQSFRFTRMTYDDITSKIIELKEKFPDTVTVFTTQERYGLDSPWGGCGHDGRPCEQHVLRVSAVSEQEQQESALLLPEGFVSGALHGNERVGPVASLHAVELMLQAHQCVAGKDAGSTACRYLDEFGVRGMNLAWLYRLVQTRAIYVIPMTNASGYSRDMREEKTGRSRIVDPNRDFPYDITNGHECMKTIAARSVNELFRDHIFQVSITFHGGMEIIAYSGDLRITRSRTTATTAQTTRHRKILHKRSPCTPVRSLARRGTPSTR